jgi:electron transfer flavoprotein alpha subunit
MSPAGLPVLCLVERDGGAIADASLRTLSFASSLATAGDGELMAVLFPGSAGAGLPGDAAPDGAAVAEQLAGYGVTEVCLVHSDRLTGYAPAGWARTLEQLSSGHAAAVVAAATDRGSEVLAHLGAMTGLPVAANCVSAQPADAGSWQLVRQRWAGSVLEDAVLAAPCGLFTVAADAVGAPEPATGVVPRAVVRTFAPALGDADLQVSATESAEQSSGMSLATARVVVGGGRGVGGPDGFAALEELAGLLGGVVGVSRVVTSQGWRPHRQQVGQTGTKISPEIYLACGISGAIQHMAGCLSARHIVAVNTDPDAPIIAHAEYAVIGDLNQVIPALVAAIRQFGEQA